jgi:hypothetical protein
MATLRQLVAQGKKMLREENPRNRSWAWGDLFLEAVPMVAKGGTHDGSVTRSLHEFAEEIGWLNERSFQSVLTYRATARAFPPDTRNPNLGFRSLSLSVPIGAWGPSGSRFSRFVCRLKRVVGNLV